MENKITAIEIPEILLPKTSLDFAKWAVIACDQFTSQPEYWQQVAALVGDAPSTYHLILPEVYLETPEEQARIKTTQQNMRNYLKQQKLEPFTGFIYVERKIGQTTRQGLMTCIDLEDYDFNKGSKSLIRATEGTILDRLPPRIRIRKEAALELPHILVLFDDPQGNVFQPIQAALPKLEKCYDFELMLGSGHLTGYKIDNATLQNQILSALQQLIQPDVFRAKYEVDENEAPLLFAIGDGNHSLATAKAIWEELKPHVGLHHPARYALVELENLHDPALAFEPIHRILFNLKLNIIEAMQAAYQTNLTLHPCNNFAAMMQQVDQQCSSSHLIGMVDSQGCWLVEINNPSSNLPVGTLQSFLDGFIKAGGAEKIDYVHGTEVLETQGIKPGNVGFYLPAMDKNALFKTVIVDGALPRKTFSMGEAKDKRFYMEARKIQQGND